MIYPKLNELAMNYADRRELFQKSERLTTEPQRKQLKLRPQEAPHCLSVSLVQNGFSKTFLATYARSQMNYKIRMSYKTADPFYRVGCFRVNSWLKIGKTIYRTQTGHSCRTTHHPQEFPNQCAYRRSCPSESRFYSLHQSPGNLPQVPYGRNRRSFHRTECCR